MSMSPDNDLMVYRTRGRPDAQEVEHMKTPNHLRNELERLKKQMNYKEGTEILLALSIASDEMTRVIHMFPEVFYMDITANANRQKRDLFLMVVKDGNGETFIGNATVVPSGKRWVFNKIYKHFFVHLYGEITISRNRLALTDDDHAQYGPFDNCIATMDCYKKSKHMLCVFHAVVMAYHSDVYPKLPHKPGNQRELTQTGDAYGMFVYYSIT